MKFLPGFLFSCLMVFLAGLLVLTYQVNTALNRDYQVAYDDLVSQKDTISRALAHAFVVSDAYSCNPGPELLDIRFHGRVMLSHAKACLHIDLAGLSRILDPDPGEIIQDLTLALAQYQEATTGFIAAYRSLDPVRPGPFLDAMREFVDKAKRYDIALMHAEAAFSQKINSGLGRMTRLVFYILLGFVLVFFLTLLSLVWRRMEKQKSDIRLRQQKELFQSVFNSQPDAIFLLTADVPARITQCNEAVETMFGYGRDELAGRTVERLHVDAGRFTRFRKVLGEAMESQGMLKDFRFEMKKKDGSAFPTEHVVLKLTNGRGRQTGWISIVRDLTERRQLEARLQQAQKMEAIGNLAGGIAHDFNNILFPMVGFAEILRDDLPGESPLQEYVGEVLQAALRAKDLVKQILAFSRQSRGEARPVRLQSVLKEVVKLLGATIPSTIEIETRIDPDCGPVMADPIQMHQIVMNLATNSYHAMQASGGTLDIALDVARLDGSGEYARITVADIGTGIAPDILERIFDPYFTTKETGKGTGLGLSVVQGIVRTCGGDIRVNSTPGQGTQIEVFLPLVRMGQEDAVPGDACGPVAGGRESILLVDDEPPIVKMIRQMLQRLGYRVTGHTASPDALAAFKRAPGRYDLVLTDMTMPEMTGLELAREIKGIRPDTPIIICTGFSEQMDEKASRALGLDGFVMKPVIIEDLARTIRVILDREQHHGSHTDH